MTFFRLLCSYSLDVMKILLTSALMRSLELVEGGIYIKFCSAVEDHWGRETGYRATFFAGAEPDRSGMHLEPLSPDVVPVRGGH